MIINNKINKKKRKEKKQMVDITIHRHSKYDMYVF